MAARVLIVEDNPTNLELMRYLLEAFGYKPTNARNGREALAVMARDLPDIVLCDVQMPEMDGYAVIREVRASETLRKIPVIAVTAFAMVGDREKMLDAGFDGYLSKPIRPETFVQSMEAFLPAELRASSSAREEAPAEDKPARAAHGDVVVIVDNVKIQLQLAASIFEYAGYTVFTASNAGQGMALCREHRPCLILSDVCMPDGSGYEFIEAVKRDPVLADIPFVFLTSTAQSESERRKGLGLGAAKYILRPIEPEVLLAEVQACMK